MTLLDLIQLVVWHFLSDMNRREKKLSSFGSQLMCGDLGSEQRYRTDGLCANIRIGIHNLPLLTNQTPTTPPTHLLNVPIISMLTKRNT